MQQSQFNDRILNDLTERINERKSAQYGGENSDAVKISNQIVKPLALPKPFETCLILGSGYSILT